MEEHTQVPKGDMVLRTLAMPADTNPNGDIFGGWIMSQMGDTKALMVWAQLSLSHVARHKQVVSVRFAAKLIWFRAARPALFPGSRCKSCRCGWSGSSGCQGLGERLKFF